MSIILGKPSKAFAGNWALTLPLDAPIPIDKTASIPTARPPSSKPTPFTHRLIEYQLLSQLPEVLKLLSGEFNIKDYTEIQQNQQKMHDLIADFPPAFRFKDPDRQWDDECPWLKTQREYTCCTTQLAFLVMHRYSMFHVAASRTETINSAIEVLRAQERHFRTLSPQHYKLYALAFFALEAATAIMVVFIAYPSENSELFEPAMQIVQESIARLHRIKSSNALARPAAELLELLRLRAESTHKSSGQAAPPNPQSSSPPTIQQIPDIKHTFHSQNEGFDFAAYTPYQNPNLEIDTSPPPFDFSCGGIIGQYGPIATMIDGNFYGVPDTWDPMILLERDAIGGYGAGSGGYGEDVY
jgi:hypothetical protein